MLWFSFPHPPEADECRHNSVHECVFKKTQEGIYQFDGYDELVCARQSKDLDFGVTKT